MTDTITVFVCNCCGKPAHAVVQDMNHPAFKNRPPLIQVECLTEGCANYYWTRAYREGGDAADNAQVTDRYTPVSMTREQATRFVQAGS